MARLTRLRWPPLMPFFCGDPMSTFSVPSRPSCPITPLDPLGDLGVAGVGRQTEPSRVVQGLAHGQVAVHDVILGHIADHTLKLAVVGVQVLPVEQHGACRRGSVAVQGVHQRCLARAAGSHQGDELRRIDHQRDGVQQPPVADFDRYALGLDSHVAAVVSLFDPAIRRQLEGEPADADPVTRPDLDLPGDAAAIDKRAVGGAEILDADGRAGTRQPGVTPSKPEDPPTHGRK